MSELEKREAQDPALSQAQTVLENPLGLEPLAEVGLGRDR